MANNGGQSSVIVENRIASFRGQRRSSVLEKHGQGFDGGKGTAQKAAEEEQMLRRIGMDGCGWFCKRQAN